jgi:predicted DNA-binding transcriptional regulator AlpA
VHIKRLAFDRDGLRHCGIRQVNSTLIDWEKKGLFPRRFKIGRCVFWDAQAVEEHLARLAKEALAADGGAE